MSRVSVRAFRKLGGTWEPHRNGMGSCAVALEIRAKADDRRKRLWLGNRMVAAVHAWFDDGAFSVSLVDADGDEIKCIGGADNSDEAVKLAVSEAQRRSVQAVFAPRAGEKSVQWRP